MDKNHAVMNSGSNSKVKISLLSEEQILFVNGSQITQMKPVYNPGDDANFTCQKHLNQQVGAHLCSTTSSGRVRAPPKELARTGVQLELISQKMPTMFFLIRKWKIITCVLKIKYGPSEIWNASENTVFGSSALWLETDQNIGSGFGLQSFFSLKQVN